MLVRFLTLSIALSIAAGAADWAGFRGPNSAGISPDRGLPDALGQDRGGVRPGGQFEQQVQPGLCPAHPAAGQPALQRRQQGAPPGPGPAATR